MWHVGIDLHRATVVMAAVSDAGEAMKPITIACDNTTAIVATVKKLGTFRVVIEASGCYRWLYDLLRPHGTVLLAHPLRLRAMIQRRSKTDKLDAQLLANLLRINQIPLAYIPPEPYQQLRDLTRGGPAWLAIWRGSRSSCAMCWLGRIGRRRIEHRLESGAERGSAPRISGPSRISFATS